MKDATSTETREAILTLLEAIWQKNPSEYALVPMPEIKAMLEERLRSKGRSFTQTLWQGAWESLEADGYVLVVQPDPSKALQGARITSRGRNYLQGLAELARVRKTAWLGVILSILSLFTSLLKTIIPLLLNR
jgi:hypothetical protein